MKTVNPFGDKIVALLPDMRDFAKRLCTDRDDLVADLVQDTVVTALEYGEAKIAESGQKLVHWMRFRMLFLYVQNPECSYVH